MNYCDVSQDPKGLPRQGFGVEEARTERFRQEEVLRFDGDYRQKAILHSNSRNDRVIELLCILSLLRSANAIQQYSDVNWDKAHYKTFHASGGRNAAHVLPCQILIDGLDPSKVVLPSFLDRSKIKFGLSHLFGHENSLPRVFNDADTIAEDHCLRGALVYACQAVVWQTQPVQRLGGVLTRGIGSNFGEINLSLADRPDASRVGIDRTAVQDAYGVWYEEATAAFNRAIVVATESGTTVYGQATVEVIYILERYRDTLSQPTAKLSNAAIARFEECFWA